jgi:transcription initiation factor TFIID subunit TAF12
MEDAKLVYLSIPALPKSLKLSSYHLIVIASMDNQKNNKKLSKVLSTKLSTDDYNAFLMLTKLEYEAGLIKEESTSELLRFTIRQILNQVGNDQIYHYLEQQEQKKAQNNQQQHQQQIHSQVILPSTTITATTSHQSQVRNISRTNNLVGQKMTPWKSSSLLSTQTNHHNTLWW